MRFISDYISNTLGEKAFGKKPRNIRKFLDLLEEAGLYTIIRRNYSLGESPELFLMVVLMKMGEHYEYRDEKKSKGKYLC